MPLIPEEPQIHESAQGPRATPASGRTAPTPRPVPGPRPAAPSRPGRPGPPRTARPPPGSARAPPCWRGSGTTGTGGCCWTRCARPAASVEGALDAAEDPATLSHHSGRTPGDVLVITTGEQHPWATHELSFGEASYWAQHDAGDDVFYTDAQVADRAEGRPVVVVAVNGGPESVTATALKAAHARAGALLIVCGDPQRINSVLGAGV
ncbi:hypothetical protein [Streptomyces sp. yara]|uniref:hypothetical protein n=1 Tax=Streptomyces sp. yara TaxID=3458421 RepID=UPI0040401382